MIIKNDDGYYVFAEKSRKRLGGPYKTKEEAQKRLDQVEYFKEKRKNNSKMNIHNKSKKF